MLTYYTDTLAAEKLKRCYDLATPAVRRYLAAEIQYVRQWIRHGTRVLELGCGYGRVLRDLATTTDQLFGIDTSYGSLAMAQQYLGDHRNVTLAQADAVRLAFSPRSFDELFPQPPRWVDR